MAESAASRTARPTVLFVGTGEPMDEALVAAMERHGLDVERSDAESAGGAARAAAPDLVLLAGDAAAGAGAKVLAQLAASPQTQVVPVALLATESALDTRLEAFRHGVVAVIPRSASADEVARRVATLARELPERAGEASGDLGEATLDELMALVKSELKTGILSVESKTGVPGVTEGSGAFRLVLGAGKPVAKAVEEFVAQLRPLVSKAEPLRWEFHETAASRLHSIDPGGEREDGDLAVFTGLRVLLVVPDPVRADALATELRARGATVGVTDASGRGLERARSLDAEVVVLDAAGLEGRGFEVVRAMRRDARLRWASMLIAHWDELWPEGAAAPDMKRIAGRIAPLVEPDRALTERARKEASFDTRLEVIGPSRLVRALVHAGRTLHVTVRNPRVVIELDIAEGLVVGGSATREDTQTSTLEGTMALAALLALASGRVRIEWRERPSVANVMSPVDEALSAGAAESPPIPASLPPPNMLGALGSQTASEPPVPRAARAIAPGRLAVDDDAPTGLVPVADVLAAAAAMPTSGGGTAPYGAISVDPGPLSSPPPGTPHAPIPASPPHAPSPAPTPGLGTRAPPPVHTPGLGTRSPPGAPSLHTPGLGTPSPAPHAPPLPATSKRKPTLVGVGMGPPSAPRGAAGARRPPVSPLAATQVATASPPLALGLQSTPLGMAAAVVHAPAPLDAEATRPAAMLSPAEAVLRAPEPLPPLAPEAPSAPAIAPLPVVSVSAPPVETLGTRPVTLSAITLDARTGRPSDRPLAADGFTLANTSALDEPLPPLASETTAVEPRPKRVSLPILVGGLVVVLLLVTAGAAALVVPRLLHGSTPVNAVPLGVDAGRAVLGIDLGMLALPPAPARPAIDAGAPNIALVGVGVPAIDAGATLAAAPIDAGSIVIPPPPPEPDAGPAPPPPPPEPDAGMVAPLSEPDAGDGVVDFDPLAPSADDAHRPANVESANFLTIRAARLVAQNDLRDAEVLYLRALQQDRHNPHALAGLASLHLARHASRDALRYAQAAVAVRPGRAAYRVILGDAFAQSGRRTDAVTQWREALRLDSHNATARARLHGR